MVIMKSYGVMTRNYRGEWEGVGTIGLDWLGRGWGGGWRGGWRIPAGLVSSASPSQHLSPHSPLPQSLSTPPSTSI